MKYVITGGAGFIGSHIAGSLARDHELVILDNLFSGREENIRHLLDSSAVRFVMGSVTDLPLLRQVCEGACGVFHQAAIASVPRSIEAPLATNEANITGTLNILVAARDAGVKKVVFASSSSIYGETPALPKKEEMAPSPKSPYAVSKLAGEHYCRVFSEVFGLSTVALRYFNVFGPRQDPKSDYAAVIPRFITRILQNESPVVHGDGRQTRDFTYVRDVVQANVKAMESSADGVFNVACGRRIDLLELCTIIMEKSGHHPPLRFGDPRPGDIRDSLADISAARNAFGYVPEYTVERGLEETIAWYRQR